MTPKQRTKQLHALGFDGSIYVRATRKTNGHHRVACSGCQALVINGIPAHETGCSNAMHECNGCNALIPARYKYCMDCQ